MTLNLILFITLVFVNATMAFTLGIAATPHKQVIIENTLPKDKLTDPAVRTLAKEYRLRLWQLAGLVSLFSISLLFPQRESVLMTLFWLSLLLTLGLSYALEIRYIRKMHALKVARGWQLPVAPIMVDTKLVQNKNRKLVSFIWLLPSLVLTLGYLWWVARHDPDSLAPLSLAAISLWLFSWAMWLVIKHLPVRPVTKEAAINQQFNDLTKHTWSMMMVGMPYFLLFLLWLPQVMMNTTGIVSTLSSVVFGLLIVTGFILTFWLLLRLRKRQDQLLNQVPDYRYTGEDEYWRFGMYINPQDSRIMVPDRVGMNIGINLGRPAGKVFGIASLVLIFGLMIGTLIPVYRMDFVKDAFIGKITEDTLVLDAPFARKSEIPLSAIKAVALVPEMPGKTVRTNGYGGENYLTGDFKVAGKKATLYLNVKQPPYLHVSTKNRDYYFSNRTEAQTRALYEKIQSQFPD